MQARLGSGRQSLTDRPKSYRKRKNYFLKESFLFLKEIINFKIKVFFWLNIKFYLLSEKKFNFLPRSIIYFTESFEESIMFQRKYYF